MDRMIRRSLAGGVYTKASPDFQRGPLRGMSRCIKTDNDAGYIARIEVRPCAMRGRNTDDSSQLSQRLEIRDDKISNCITSVSKDAMYIGKVEK